MNIDVVLTGCEKGNRVNVIRQTVDHGLENQFHLLGLVSPEKMHLLYSKSLALTYLSILGPDNMPPLEAMNLKCPVICAKYDGAEMTIGRAVYSLNSLSRTTGKSYFKPFTKSRNKRELDTERNNSGRTAKF